MSDRRTAKRIAEIFGSMPGKKGRSPGGGGRGNLILWNYWTGRCGGNPGRRGLAPAGIGIARGILRFVIGVSPTRAQIVIVMFALAMVYGSICSASCVAGDCPNLEQYSEGHNCDQHSQGPHDHGQHGPACKQHGHPPDFVLKGSGIAPLQDQGASGLRAGAVLASLTASLTITQDILRESYRRPPGVFKNTLHQQVSILRI
jgi:hypothetical protein